MHTTCSGYISTPPFAGVPPQLLLVGSGWGSQCSTSSLSSVSSSSAGMDRFTGSPRSAVRPRGRSPRTEETRACRRTSATTATSVFRKRRYCPPCDGRGAISTGGNSWWWRCWQGCRKGLPTWGLVAGLPTTPYSKTGADGSPKPWETPWRSVKMRGVRCEPAQRASSGIARSGPNTQPRVALAGCTGAPPHARAQPRTKNLLRCLVTPPSSRWAPTTGPRAFFRQARANPNALPLPTRTNTPNATTTHQPTL